MHLLKFLNFYNKINFYYEYYIHRCDKFVKLSKKNAKLIKLTLFQNRIHAYTYFNLKKMVNFLSDDM